MNDQYSPAVEAAYCHIPESERRSDPIHWNKQLLIPLLIGAICRNWTMLQSPRGIPASYEYVSHTAS